MRAFDENHFSQYLMLNPCMFPSDEDHRRSFSGPERNLRPCLRDTPASGPPATVKAMGSHLGVLCRALKVQLQERSSACGHSKWHPSKTLSSYWGIKSTHAHKRG